MPGLWHPRAWVVLGPEWKTGYVGLTVRDKPGIVGHSMEGPMCAALAVLKSVHPSSWPFSNPKLPGFYQHYAVPRVAWHGGSRDANRFSGIEHEGVAGEPLTGAQIEDDIDIILWLSQNDVAPWPGFDRGIGGTLIEHCECVAFGSPPTVCPSGRIPWQVIQDEIKELIMYEVLKERIDQMEAAEGLRRLAEDLRNGLIADLVAGRYAVRLNSDLTRSLVDVATGVAVKIP